MVVFVTKTWGFDSPCGPLQFSTSGARDSAIRELQSGDLVVIVGTKGPETDDRDKGLILGLMEPTTVPVQTLDYRMANQAHEYNAAGEYRWPYALALSRAWQFAIPRRSFGDLTDRPQAFGMPAAQGLVKLTDAEAQAILALPRQEVELLTSFGQRVRVEGVSAARKKTAPPPATQRRGIMHMRRASAYTYAMEIVGAKKSSIKVGWAFEWRDRQRHFNQVAMPEIGGIQYKTFLHRLHATARDAFVMEQKLLKKFDGLRHGSNSEIISPISKNDFEKVWIEFLVGKMSR